MKVTKNKWLGGEGGNRMVAIETWNIEKKRGEEEGGWAEGLLKTKLTRSFKYVKRGILYNNK